MLWANGKCVPSPVFMYVHIYCLLLKVLLISVCQLLTRMASLFVRLWELKERDKEITLGRLIRKLVIL